MEMFKNYMDKILDLFNPPLDAPLPVCNIRRIWWEITQTPIVRQMALANSIKYKIVFFVLYFYEALIMYSFNESL